MSSEWKNDFLSLSDYMSTWRQDGDRRQPAEGRPKLQRPQPEDERGWSDTPIHQPRSPGKASHSFENQLRQKRWERWSSEARVPVSQPCSSTQWLFFGERKPKVSEEQKPVEVNVVLLRRRSGSVYEKLGVYCFVKFLASCQLPLE